MVDDARGHSKPVAETVEPPGRNCAEKHVTVSMFLVEPQAILLNRWLHMHHAPPPSVPKKTDLSVVCGPLPLIPFSCHSRRKYLWQQITGRSDFQEQQARPCNYGKPQRPSSEDLPTNGCCVREDLAHLGWLSIFQSRQCCGLCGFETTLVVYKKQ